MTRPSLFPMIVHINRRRPSRAHIARLAQWIDNSQPAVLPTETQYALACDATSRKAIDAVRVIKGRHPAAPFSIFLPGPEALAKWKIRYPDYAQKLASRFWPGPLTLVLSTSNPHFKLLGGDGKSVGVRVTPEPIINMLMESTGSPLIATSANPSGVNLTSLAENRWLETLAESRGLVWARPERYVRRSPSTVIDCTGKVPRELRPGPISKAEWNAALCGGV
jgi:L-threonylcarbamoyladenylate synthase